MPRIVTEYRCLLISPSDVELERAALSEVVNRWNAHDGRVLGVRVDLVRSEIHSIPDSSAAPQASLNSQIVDACDFGIAVFWARVGTPTVSEESGSIEEIKRLCARGMQVLIYFNAAPVAQAALKDDQFKRLQKFKRELYKRALVRSYNSLDDLREQVHLHLTTAVHRLLESDHKQSTPTDITSEVATAPMPDVRVEVRVAVAGNRFRPGVSQTVLDVIVANHSPVTVYIENVCLTLSNLGKIVFLRDAVTWNSNMRRPLEPGASYSFMMRPREIFRHVREAGAEVLYAVATDAIGREYRSSEESMRTALDLLRGDEN